LYFFVANGVLFIQIDEAKDLIRKLLIVNPEERITAKAALKHEWFRVKAGRKTMHKEFKTQLSRHNSKRKSMVRSIPPFAPPLNKHGTHCFLPADRSTAPEI
jgi:serine/threonine protein kinase